MEINVKDLYMIQNGDIVIVTVGNDIDGSISGNIKSAIEEKFKNIKVIASGVSNSKEITIQVIRPS